MSEPAPNPQDAASPAVDEVPDPSVVRAARRLRLLEELTEIGMELARALRPGAAQAGEDRCDDEARAKGRDPADAFSRLSRAIRLTLALEARTDAELGDLKAGVARSREDEQAKAAERAQTATEMDLMNRKADVAGLLASIALAEIGEGGEWENLWAAAEERLDEDEAYENLDRWPLRETVKRLCKDLDFSPDWSRWDNEDLSGVDANGRCFFSPFKAPSARPLMNPCPRPEAVDRHGRPHPVHHLE